MNKWTKTLLSDLAALILGISLTLAFAPYEIFPLAVLAPAGLLVLWLNASKGRAFWLGFVFGLGLFGTGVYWVFNSIHDIGGVPTPLALFITSSFIIILSLYPALTGYLLNRYFPNNNKTKILYAYPAIWVSLEWLRGNLFTGFPWLFIGYSETNSPLKGYAPIFSVYGVSLAVLLTSALLVYAYRQYQQREYRSSYLYIFSIIAIWTLGGLLSLIPWTKPTGQPISVALVQGNIPQTLKWSPEHLQLSLDRYEQLTAPLWGKNNIIIWPEAAVPLPLPNAASYINALDAKAMDTGSALILGIPIHKPDDGYFNSIITLGKSRNLYNKRHLVPFGEYTPYQQYFSTALNFLDLPLSDGIAGNERQQPLQINGVKISPSICYEIAYPELTRIKDKSIGMLLTLTNDAWFGQSNAEPQHLQMAQMRALELGRPLLFVSNDGITAIIGPDGKIESTAPQREIYVLKGTVQPMYGVTPWMFNGTDPIIFILICFIFTAIWAKKTEARTLQQNQKLRQTLAENTSKTE